MTLGYSHALSEFIFDIAGEERYLARDKMTDLFTLDSAANGVIQTLRNQLFSVSNRGDALEHQLGSDKAKLEVAISEPELVFTHDAEFEAAKLEAHELSLEVNSREKLTRGSAAGAPGHRTPLCRRPVPRLVTRPQPHRRMGSPSRGMTREAVIASVPAKMAEARKEREENAQAREDNERHQLWQSIDASEVNGATDRPELREARCAYPLARPPMTLGKLGGHRPTRPGYREQAHRRVRTRLAQRRRDGPRTRCPAGKDSRGEPRTRRTNPRSRNR